MKKPTFLVTLLLMSTSYLAQAAIIETSLNPNVSPGLVSYADANSGWPTPHQDPSVYATVPTQQTQFGQYDPIRIAQSISLGDLDEATDDNGLAAWDLNALIWVVEWWAPSAVSAPTGFNTLSYAWDDIALDLLNGDTQLTFFTDLYIPNNFAPLEVGQWSVQSYFENDNAYRGPISFSVVPEPVTLFLFAGGLLLLSVTARRHGKQQNTKTKPALNHH